MEKYITTIGKGEVMRVYKFAKEFDKQSGDFVHELKSVFKFDVKSHLSGLTEEQMDEVREFYNKEKTPSSQITDLIGKEEGEIHHEEAMKEAFNVADSIKTNIETAKSAREQYAKTVKKIVADPKEWSSPNVKKQEVIVEKPGWFTRLFSWLIGN